MLFPMQSATMLATMAVDLIASRWIWDEHLEPLEKQLRERNE